MVRIYDVRYHLRERAVVYLDLETNKELSEQALMGELLEELADEELAKLVGCHLRQCGGPATSWLPPSQSKMYVFVADEGPQDWALVKATEQGRRQTRRCRCSREPAR